MVRSCWRFDEQPQSIEPVAPGVLRVTGEPGAHRIRRERDLLAIHVVGAAVRQAVPSVGLKIAVIAGIAIDVDLPSYLEPVEVLLFLYSSATAAVASRTTALEAFHDRYLWRHWHRQAFETLLRADGVVLVGRQRDYGEDGDDRDDDHQFDQVKPLRIKAFMLFPLDWMERFAPGAANLWRSRLRESSGGKSDGLQADS